MIDPNSLFRVLPRCWCFHPAPCSSSPDETIHHFLAAQRYLRVSWQARLISKSALLFTAAPRGHRYGGQRFKLPPGLACLASYEVSPSPGSTVSSALPIIGHPFRASAGFVRWSDRPQQSDQCHPIVYSWTSSTDSIPPPALDFQNQRESVSCGCCWPSLIWPGSTNLLRKPTRDTSPPIGWRTMNKGRAERSCAVSALQIRDSRKPAI